MSGTTGLGGLLATRLDAVMGTTLAKHPVVLDAKPGHNVAQAAQNIHGQDSTIRRAAEQVGARTGQADARQLGLRGGATAEAGPGSNTGTQNPFASARTLLSEPAQTILALLLGNLQGKAALQGRFPLLPLPPAPAAPGPGPGGAPAGQAGTAPGGAPGGTPGTPGAGQNAAGAAAGGNAAAGSAGASGAGGGAAATNASTAASAPAAAGARPGAGAPLPGSVATTALPPAPPGMAPAMAAALQQTVNQSGLFYESHLAQLAFGKRDAAEVLREPQARLPQPGQAQAPSGTANGPAAGQGATAGAAGAGNAAGQAAPAANAGMMANAAGGAAAAGMAGAAAGAAASSGVNLSLAAQASQAGSAALAGIHPEAIPLVRQQLEALANQAFQWQGQAWDGANMNWEIQRREPEEGQGEAVATWATRLNLELPRLGNVEARLSLADNRLVLRLVAPSSAPLLQEHLNVLRERLLSQGLQLTDTAVSAAALAPGAAGAGTAAAATTAAAPGTASAGAVPARPA